MCTSFFHLRFVCDGDTKLLAHVSRFRRLEGVTAGQRRVEHAIHTAVFGVNCLKGINKNQRRSAQMEKQ